jgi:undecaprenyl-diphosphatase
MTFADLLTPVDAIDRWTSLTLNSQIGRLPILDQVVFYVADLNLLKGVPFMAAAWYFWFRGDKGTRNHVVDFFLAALLASVIAQVLAVSLPERPRPLHEATLGLELAAKVRPTVLKDWSSFPSGHAALFFALAVGLMPLSRKLAWAAIIWVAVVICLPRVYLGYHYLSDILGGAAIGTGVAALYPRLPLHRWGGSLVGLADRAPSMFHAVAFVATFELTVMLADVRQLGSQAIKVMRMLSG